MRELHVVALSEDGRHVVLATRAGAPSGEFRIALDERLTAAVRGELPAPGRDAPPSISPRDIQARLRDGESPEDIAASAGVPLSRVERYAGPVLAELERMITGARAAVVHRPRLGPSARPLGEAVEVHLAEVAHLTEDSVRWSARRGEHGRWVVSVSWTARGRRRTAGWHYDPASREVSAVDGPSAVLGHVEADTAVAATAAARAPRPAAATSAARTTGARASAATRPAPTPAASPSRSSPAATGSGARSAPPTRAAAPAAPAARSTASGSATTRTTAPVTAPTPAASSAARRRTVTSSTPAAATPARPTRTTAATPTRAAAPDTAAPTPARAPRRRTPAAQGPAATRTAAQPRRPAARRSAVPSLDALAGASTDVPAVPTPSAPAPSAPTPAGPPLLRVVPPAAPELDQPEPAEDAAPSEARPARRAAGQRAGGRDWADVLMGGAPAPPAAEPRQD